MDDRVRIYELARRMNVPNQDVINVLRELGYDIKSHSSTIDKTAVGAYIAHADKKNKKPEGDTKGKTKAAAATKAPPVKAAPAKLPPPPEPEKVKPRVLSRYRPEKPPVDGQESPTPGAAPSGAPSNGGTPGPGSVAASAGSASGSASSTQAAPSTSGAALSHGPTPINSQTQISSRPVTAHGASAPSSMTQAAPQAVAQTPMQAQALTQTQPPATVSAKAPEAFRGGVLRATVKFLPDLTFSKRMTSPSLTGIPN